MKRTLQEEQDLNKRLLEKLKETDNEKDMLQRIVEQQEIQNNMHSNEITRLSKRAAELSKRVVKEQVKREGMISDITYSNPAKLMNYMKAKKAKGNSSYRSMAEYVSHVDVYARKKQATSVDKHEPLNTSGTSTDQRRLKYAKLLA